jgi:pimeloyl-ACP methyl ester carboxylesterase
MYQARRPSRSEFVPIRHLKYHVRQWGQPAPGVAPLVMVHGWMDVGASYQFVVDAMAANRWVIAPDWRGYGLTGFDAAAPGGPSYLPATDHYTFADYLADLDALLDHYAPGQPVDLVGHSMGGNIVMLYAGVRPERIRRLVNLEGFGMPATRPAQAAGRYAKWMDEIKAIHTGAMALKTYDSVAGVASRLMKTNPRLGQDKADWLAPHWAAQAADGRWAILGDAAHKVINPQLYRVEEVLDIYGRITAPVLAVEASDNELDRWWKGKFTLAEYHERLEKVPQVRQGRVTDAGHMLHHDQPAQLAALIEDFTA